MIKLKNISGPKIKLIDLDMKYLDDMFEYSSDSRIYEYLEFEAHKTKNDRTKLYCKKVNEKIWGRKCSLVVYSTQRKLKGCWFIWS